MHALGVPTTRALSLVASGDEVYRDQFYNGNVQLEPGAVVCRVSPCFVRFGSFQLPATRCAALALSPSGSPYWGNVVVTCASAACKGKSQTIAVTLTVSAPPAQLSLGTTLLSFARGIGKCTGTGSVAGDMACKADFTIVVPSILDEFRPGRA